MEGGRLRERVTLPNGVVYPFAVKGKTSPDDIVVLSPAGGKADPAPNAITIKTTITPLEGGWAKLESCSGTGYGQRLEW